jgi:hypothetical protein
MAEIPHDDVVIVDSEVEAIGRSLPVALLATT